MKEENSGCGANGRDLISLFFFNATATTEIYTLSLHDALPISTAELRFPRQASGCATIAAKARGRDRKSTRLNSSHVETSYAVFCLKKKTSRISPHAIRLQD